MTVVAVKQLWKEWIKKAVSLTPDCPPMDRDLSMTYLGLCIQEQQGQTYADNPAIEKDFIVRIARGRLAQLGVQATPQVLLLVSVVSEGNPGSCVMYCHVLKYIHLSGDAKVIGLEDVSAVFQRGFYTQDQLYTLWDAQKFDGANVLDHVNAETLAG